MAYNDLSWSPSEKKAARAAFDKALEVALASTIAEFKRKADAAATPADLWEIEEYLGQRRRKIDRMFDYRYSQLPEVFASLIRAGYLDENLLSGLSQEKREMIHRFATWKPRG
ncbi:MAG: hypothetical protein HOQ25_00270 [Mesorhizobium sp.]|nr:hypothetical protein [Mesorhizobium sp.]